MGELQLNTRARGYRLVLVALLTAAGIGFFAEMRREPPALRGYSAESDVSGVVEGVKTYPQLRQSSRGPSHEMYVASAELLRARLPKPTDPVVRQEGDREAMLEQRSLRRAFDGAPPTVPHPIDSRAKPNCLVCHEHGAKIGELIAPMISHAPYVSCVQCHAPAIAGLEVSGAGDEPSGVTVAAKTSENAFEPAPMGGQGTRAWPGAPPTVPHRLQMRENCASCHGVSGMAGLRSTHPDRQSCQQCHAAQAASDQIMARFLEGVDEWVR